MEITDLNALEMLSSKIKLLSQKVDENSQKKNESVRDYKTPEQACAILHIKPRTLQALRTSGKLPYSKIEKKVFYHFGLMLNTDIYDFAAFAKRYDCDPDIEINSIFVSGKKMEDMYRQPNPMGDQFATLNEIYTEQGIQYITFSEIYSGISTSVRNYRYWQCNGDYSTSFTDERYSHVERREITTW